MRNPYSYVIGPGYSEPWIPSSPSAARAERQARARGSRHYRRSDERIREDIWIDLMQDTRLDVDDLQVEVRDGYVTLHGTVATRPMKHAIEDTAAAVQGVRDVENRLRVTSSRDWPARPGRPHRELLEGSRPPARGSRDAAAGGGVAGIGGMPTSGTSRTGTAED
jgi:hypothetical protein